MKKILSFLLAVMLVVSAVPMAYATETADHTEGTVVSYTAANAEAWTVTVPAKLAPSGSGTVTLQGTWPSNKLITVTAQDNVVLTNTDKASDQKSLKVTFGGISELGSDTSSQKFTETVSVAAMPADALFGTWTGHFYYTVGTQELDTLGQLQEQYDFEYYSTMNLAVTDVNNGAIGASADVDKEDAVAGIYIDENGGVNVVLLQDHTEATRIQPAVDMTINLGGHILSSNDILGIKAVAGKVTIDGRLDGSGIEIIRNEAVGARPIQVQGGCELVVNGGTYICGSNGYSGTQACIYLADGAIATISDAKIIGTETSGNLVGVRIGTSGAATANISNCTITISAEDGHARGIDNIGTATISNCDIRAYANYLYGDETYYAALSIGVGNSGTLTINDCYTIGTHSGLQNNGTLYVNGGTYEGFGHGGFYFIGDGSGNTSYVRNAIIRQCAMPDGYTATANCNGAGFYIGGSAEANNITVNMDNCDIYGSSNQIVLRGSDGEQNNSLYISNSNVYDMDGDTISIRIDNDTHRLYIGTGNNFTVDNAVTWGSITNWDGIVINTDETYTYNG